MENLIYVLIATSVVGLAYSFWKSTWVKAQETGNLRMQTFSKHIAEGVSAFLKAEYKVLFVFGLAVAVLLFFGGQATDDSNGLVAISYVVGLAMAVLSVFLGMRISVRAQVRTLAAAQNSSKEAFRIAFSSAAVSGLGAVSFAILGLSALFLIYNAVGFARSIEEVLNVIAGYALGATTVALFAQVGGGILFQSSVLASEVGANADYSIPKTNVLNPAFMTKASGTILNQSGGATSDLFQSLAASVVAAMVIGAAWLNADSVKENFELGPVVLPLALAASGIIVSMLSAFFVKIKEGGSVQKSIFTTEIGATLAMAAVSYFVVNALLPNEWIWPVADKYDYFANGVWSSAVFGLVGGLLISTVSRIYSDSTLNIAGESQSGFFRKFAQALNYGMKTTVIPVFVVAIITVAAYYFAGLYGMAVAAVGMLANTGFRIASDTFVAVAENADNLATMSALGQETSERVQTLKADSMSLANSGRVFAVSASTLTALALTAAFMQKSDVEFSSFGTLTSIVGLAVGALIPLLFSLTFQSIAARVTSKIIDEVRRQFLTITPLKSVLSVFLNHCGTTPGLTGEENTILHDAEKSVEYTVCTKKASVGTVNQVIYIAIIAILLPLIAGFFGGAVFLNGMLLSIISVSLLISIFKVNLRSIKQSSAPAVFIFSTISLSSVVKFIAITALLIATSLTSESDFEEKNAIGATYELNQIQNSLPHTSQNSEFGTN